MRTGFVWGQTVLQWRVLRKFRFDGRDNETNKPEILNAMDIIFCLRD